VQGGRAGAGNPGDDQRRVHRPAETVGALLPAPFGMGATDQQVRTGR
jgi:hypothetical protein